MSDKNSPNKGALTLSGDRGLATKRAGLVERGLELIDEVKKRQVIEVDYFKLGHAWYYKGNFDQAITYFSKAIEIGSNRADAYYFRGLTFERKGDIDLASADYAKALVIKSDYPPYAVTYSFAFTMDPRIDPNYVNIIHDLPEAKWKQALSCLSIPITLRQSLFYCNKGHICYIEGYFHQAITEYTKALEIDPYNVLALYYRGNVWKLLDNHNQAIADYTKALEINPIYAYLYFNRGESWFELYELDRCIADFTKALEIDPGRRRIYYNRGIAFTEKGDLDRGIEDFTKALEKGENHESIYFLRGLAWAKKENYDKAITDYGEALRVDPQHAWAFYNRGKARERNGDPDGATADYNKALKINPNVDKTFSYRRYRRDTPLREFLI